MKSLIILAFFISGVVLLMSASVYFFYISPVDKFSFQTTAYVTEDLAGFDINSTALTFGSITVGGSSTRSVMVNNSYSFPVRVEPEFEGNIEKIISYSALRVEPHQTSRFHFTISADSPELLGNYTGNITLKLIRVPN